MPGDALQEALDRGRPFLIFGPDRAKNLDVFRSLMRRQPRGPRLFRGALREDGIRERDFDDLRRSPDEYRIYAVEPDGPITPAEFVRTAIRYDPDGIQLTRLDAAAAALIARAFLGGFSNGSLLLADCASLDELLSFLGDAIGDDFIRDSFLLYPLLLRVEGETRELIAFEPHGSTVRPIPAHAVDTPP